ncbi:MAG: hypothetical protein OEY11_08495 [Gammaproteobacteria bacterium]|nr:hypothetical protein [Gammaproteobacteria bacterium]
MKLILAVLVCGLLLPLPAYSCEINRGAAAFASAFLSGDVSEISRFYQPGSVVSIESDFAAAIAKQSASNKRQFKVILKQFLEHKKYRKVAKKIHISKRKIEYGGSDFISYPFHWLLRSIQYRCVADEFKITHIYLIDGR